MYVYVFILLCIQWRRPGAEFGGTKNFFAELRFFRKKFPFSWAVTPPHIFGGTVPPVPPRSPPLCASTKACPCLSVRLLLYPCMCVFLYVCVFRCEGVDSVTVSILIDGRPREIGVYCGSKRPPQLMSNGERMDVVFSSRSFAKDAKGFRANFSFVTGTLSALSALFKKQLLPNFSIMNYSNELFIVLFLHLHVLSVTVTITTVVTVTIVRGNQSMALKFGDSSSLE